MVSSCVRWLYCCNPPNPIVVSVPCIHTHIHWLCAAVTWSSGKKQKSSCFTWNTHDSLIQAQMHTCAHKQPRTHWHAKHRPTVRPIKIHLFCLWETNCKLHMSTQCIFFIFCFKSLLIHSSEDWTTSSLLVSGQPELLVYLGRSTMERESGMTGVDG